MENVIRSRVTGIAKFTMMLDEAQIVYRTLLADGEVTVIVPALSGPNAGGDEGADSTWVFCLQTGRLLYYSATGPLVEERENTTGRPMDDKGRAIKAS